MLIWPDPEENLAPPDESEVLTRQSLHSPWVGLQAFDLSSHSLSLDFQIIYPKSFGLSFGSCGLQFQSGLVITR